MDDYESIIVGDKANEVKQSVSSVIDKNPDVEARFQNLAKTYGIPVTAIRLDPETTERRAKLDSYDYESIVKTLPSTASLMADPNKAAIAHDDIENLSLLEKNLRFTKNIGMAALSGINSAGGGVLGLVQAPLELAAEVTDPLVGRVLPENIFRRMVGGISEKRQSIAATAQGDMPKADWVVSGGFYSGVASFSRNVAAMPLLFAPGGQNAALAAMVAPVGGEEYGKARDKGLSPLVSAAYGTEQAAIEYVTERLPMSWLVKDLKAGTPYLKTLANQMAAEIPGEQLATVFQDMNEWAVLNPQKPFSDYIKERPSAAAQTLIATMVGVGGQTTVVKTVDMVLNGAKKQEQAVNQSEQSIQLIEKINTAMQASKVLQRDPETMAEFLQQVAEGSDLSHVYFDGKALMQTGIVEQLAQVSPAIAEQAQTAAETGGVVAIPIAEFETKIVPTEYGQPLMEILRTEPEGFSRAEAKTWEAENGQALQDEIQKAIGTQQTVDAFRASQETVKASIAEQLNALQRFTPEKNEADAMLMSSYYAVRAAQLGITPEQHFQNHPPRFAAEGVFAEAYNQTPDEILAMFDGEPTINIEAPGITPMSEQEKQDAERQFLSTRPAGETHYSRRSRRIEGIRQLSEAVTNELGKEAETARKNIAKLGAFSEYEITAEILTPDEFYNQGGTLKVYIYGKEQAQAGLMAEPALTFTVTADGELSVNGPIPDGPTFNEFKARGWADYGRNADGSIAEGWSVLRDPERPGKNLPIAQSTPLIADVHARMREWRGTDVVGLHWSRATGAMGGLFTGENGSNAFFQLAYHGSPYKFDKFSLEHMGKGEGAQAYGWGLYFAGSKEVAEFYRQGLSNVDLRVDGKEYDNDNPAHRAASEKYEAEKNGWAISDVVARINRSIEDLESRGKKWATDEAALQRKTVELLESGAALPKYEEVSDGQLYEVDIPEDNTMLLWDKPLSEQPEIRSKLEKAGYGRTDTPGISGAYYAPQNAIEAKALVDAGINGIKFLDGSSRSKGEGSYNYVVFDDAAIEVLQTYYQPGNTFNRASYQPDTNTITLLAKANLSSFLHETGHLFFENDIQLAADLIAKDQLTPGEQQIVNDVSALFNHLGIQGDTNSQMIQWFAMPFEEKRSHHEKIAESFEAYLFEGKAPSIELQSYFQTFRAWLTNVYKSLKAFLAGHPEVKINDELRQVFDRMLATDEQIRLAEQARSMFPMFETAEQAGMTPDEFAQYQKLGEDATDNAVESLQQRALRDMKWLANAKAKVLKKMQQEAKSQRAEVMIEARREVMAQPIYRAWQFLTGKIGKEDKIEAAKLPKSDPGYVDETMDSLFVAIAKLGGINKDEAISTWGIDPADKPQSGVFGKPVWRVKDGLSLDGMAESLSQYGYLTKDEHGKVELRELEEKFSAELRGDTQYSISYAPEQFEQQQIANPQALQAGRFDLAALEAMFSGTTLEIDRATMQRVARTFSEAKEAAGAFVGKPLENKASGSRATVSKGTLGKMLSASAARKSVSHAEHALAVANLDVLFANALLNNSHADSKGEPTIAAIRRFVAPMIGQDGAVLAVKMTVKETTGQGQPNPLYSVEAIDVEKPTREAPSNEGIERGADETVADAPTGGLTQSVWEAIQKVKNDLESFSNPLVLSVLKANRMTAKEGLHPDLVAEMFGFTSGDELTRTLAAAMPPREAIETLTDQKMIERFADLSTPEAIEEAADIAVHNDLRARVVAAEANALAKASGGQRIMAQAARQFADSLIARLKIKDIRPHQYTTMEARAAKAAEKARKAGDIAQAAVEKRNQLIQLQVAKAALEAKVEMENLRRQWSEFANRSDDKLKKAYDMDLVNTVRAIIGEYGIAEKRAKRASEYLDVVKENDAETYAIIEPMAADAERNAKPFREMTVEEARGAAADIESILFLARRARQIEIDGQKIDRQLVTDELSARLDALGVPDALGQNSAVTDGEKRMLGYRTLLASLRRVESWAGQMDGDNPMGAFRRYIYGLVKTGADQYRAEKGATLKKLRQLFDAIAPSMKPQVIAAPELGYTFGKGTGGVAMNEILHAILHSGNESNKRKLLLGRGWAAEIAPGVLDTGRWDAFLARMKAEGKLTQAHFDFAQGVWDLLETMKPGAQKTHREVFGKYFDEVSADSFVDPFGVTRRGGYVPAIADPLAVTDAKLRALAEAENNNLAYAFPATSKGFTKSRVEYNRPLLLDMRTLSQHVDKVLLFTHMEMPVRDVQRVVKSIGGQLDRFDPGIIAGMITPWLNRAAKQQVMTPVSADGGSSRFAAMMRSRAGMALMFGNIANAVQQVTGFSLAAVKVKPRLLLSAMADFAKHPRKLAQSVAEASPYMADRMANEVAAMNEELNQIMLNPSLLKRAQDWSMRHAYFLQSAIDNCMSPVVWTAAYNQAIEHGMSHDDAVKLGDSAVRETQGSTLPEDIARIESGNAWLRLFTQFAGYFNMQANLLGSEFGKMMQSGGLRKNAIRGTYVFALGFLAPAIVGEAIMLAFRGGVDDEDKDGEYLDDWLAALLIFAPLRTATAMVPVAGTTIIAGVNRWNKKPYDDRIINSPVASMAEGALGAPVSIYKAVSGDGSKQKAVRDTATLISLTIGVPANIAARPLGYLAGMSDDKIAPTGAVDMARGLVHGTASPESKQR